MARAKNEALTITCATFFDELLVIKPADDIVSAFEAVIASIFDLLPASQQQSLKLAAIRDYLIPNLLSSQSRVGSGAKSLPELTSPMELIRK